METKHHKLGEIQNKLVAKKDAYNSFGKYKYRSCESILAALKPLLAEHGYSVTLDDDIQAVGDRVYVKSTCTLSDADGNTIAESHAFAREALAKKGMDESQCTGAASSYARKYALCGMFAIDDSSLDPDKTNDGTSESDAEIKVIPLSKSDYEYLYGSTDKEDLAERCKNIVDEGKDRSEVTRIYKEVSAKFSK